MRLRAVVSMPLLLVVASAGAEERDLSTRILIAFHSETGNTEALAGLLRDGIASVEGVEVRLRALDAVTDDEIRQADGILLGTPVHWATVSVETKAFLDRVGAVLLAAGGLGEKVRTAGAFCTGGGAAMGKEMARLTVLSAFLTMRFVVVGGIEGEGFGTLGPEATTPDPLSPMTSEEKAAARASGERFARLTKQMRRGSASLTRQPSVEVGAVPVVRARGAPVIDGVAEELWSSAVARRLERSKGPVPTSADIQGEFRAMWDEEALYLFVQVLDDQKVTGEGYAPWNQDGVEVYVDGDGGRTPEYDDDDHQYVFRWNDPAAHEANAASVEGIRFAQGEWEYGYRMEVAIPWGTIGVPPPGGRAAIGLDVHVNDNDGMGREDKLMWSDSADMAHSEPRRFGQALLLDSAQATGEQRAALTAPAPDLQAELAAGPPLRLQYHDIRTDADGMIVPWSHDDPARAYDHVIRLVWGFWRDLEDCPNGVKYPLQHQVWKPQHDPRGLGGDQISMALSSWNLLHQYLGDPAVVADMQLQADYWIENGFTGPEGPWRNLPFPYNTDVHSGRYDGDMIAGRGFLQPDKAGSFGAELVTLYKITGRKRYLEVAIGIADTLTRNVKPGDGERSPWPYRVHFETDDVFEREEVRFTYTTNWTGALRLFDDLIAMGKGRVAEYERARSLVGDWLKAYPLKTQRWGPFFEDINTYSDTQINAGTLALYILEHPGWMPDGGEAVRRILDHCDRAFGNPLWAKYGVRATNEQTAYEVPGNSHTSRQASLELMWGEAAGDPSRKAQATRNLNWATYMVAADGRNRYYRDDIWLTDGYGDYVRHYLRAMAAAPELAPPDQNHLLRTSSVVRHIGYGADAIVYEKWDADSRERLKLGAWAPGSVEGGTVAWDPETRVLEVMASSRRVLVRRAR